MTLLPKKTTPQEWEDIPFDIFEAEAEENKQQAKRKPRKDPNEGRIQYRRYKGGRLLCQPCVPEHAEGKRMGIGNGTWVRIENGEEVVMCFHHRAEYVHREALNERREK